VAAADVVGEKAVEVLGVARSAVNVVGEKAVAAADVVGEKAVEALGVLAETGHNASVQIGDALERKFGATAEKVQLEGQKAKESALDDLAQVAELVQGHLGDAASTLREQERDEVQKTEAEKMRQYHSDARGPLDDTLERNFGEIVDEAQLEAQKMKEGTIRKTAEATEIIADAAGSAASSLREQQRNAEQQS